MKNKQIIDTQYLVQIKPSDCTKSQWIDVQFNPQSSVENAEAAIHRRLRKQKPIHGLYSWRIVKEIITRQIVKNVKVPKA